MRCARSSAALFLAAAISSSMAAAELARARLDSEHSVVLASNAGEIRLFIAAEPGGREVMPLDSFPTRSIAASPSLEVIGDHSAYLHFYGDYGLYYGSRKYVFEIGGGKAPVRVPYGIVSLRSVLRRQGTLIYQAFFAEAGKVQDAAAARQATITVEPRSGAYPNLRVVDIGPARESPVLTEPTMRGSAGQKVIVEHHTPAGQPHQASAVLVNEESFPAPVPILDFYRQALPHKQPPGEIESDIGPFVQGGDTIWFATTFYDGEGISGIGAIGSFDIAARKYQMRYLPQIAPWSGSAIMLDGDDLWIGLKRRPEGADIGGGMLRFNIRTGAVQAFAIPDVIFSIDRAADAVYCGSSHGLYLVRGGQVTQLRFEPNESGQFAMIPRDVPQQRAARPNAR